jgi:hypothetical protein
MKEVMDDGEEDKGTRVKKVGRPPIPYFQTISGSMKRSFGKTLLSAAGCTSTTGSSQANRGITAYLESYQLVDPKN